MVATASVLSVRVANSSTVSLPQDGSWDTAPAGSGCPGPSDRPNISVPGWKEKVGRSSRAQQGCRRELVPVSALRAARAKIPASRARLRRFPRPLRAPNSYWRRIAYSLRAVPHRNPADASSASAGTVLDAPLSGSLSLVRILRMPLVHERGEQGGDVWRGNANGAGTGMW
ncbi:hypothetical protein FB451DRAFT_1177657 [Mycena latifolia]|nr:hypothetical protein FB451DRAFT_1177657 [Mycena latifolia]